MLIVDSEEKINRILLAATLRTADGVVHCTAGHHFYWMKCSLELGFSVSHFDIEVAIYGEVSINGCFIRHKVK